MSHATLGPVKESVLWVAFVPRAKATVIFC